MAKRLWSTRSSHCFSLSRSILTTPNEGRGGREKRKDQIIGVAAAGAPPTIQCAEGYYVAAVR